MIPHHFNVSPAVEVLCLRLLTPRAQKLSSGPDRSPGIIQLCVLPYENAASSLHLQTTYLISDNVAEFLTSGRSGSRQIHPQTLVRRGRLRGIVTSGRI